MSKEQSTQISEDSRKHLKEAGFDIESVKSMTKTELINLLGKILSNNHIDPQTTTTTTDTESNQSTKANPTTSPTNTPEPEPSRIETYTRPSDFTPSLGEAVLVECEDTHPIKPAAREDLLGVTETTNQNVLLIQYRPLPEDDLQAIATQSNHVQLISIACTQPVPEELTDTVTIQEIENVSDVTELGIAATGIVNEWKEIDGKISIVLDSIDEITPHKTNEGLFRFLHIFIGKLTAPETMSFFFIDPSVVDEQEIKTFHTLFDWKLTITDTDITHTRI